MLTGTAIFTALRYDALISHAVEEAKQRVLTSGNLLSAGIEAGVRYNLVGIVRSAIEQGQTDPLIQFSMLVDSNNRIFSSNRRGLEGQQINELADTSLQRHLLRTNKPFSVTTLQGERPRLVYVSRLSRLSQEHQVSNLVDRLVVVADISRPIEAAKHSAFLSALIWFSISLFITLIIWLALRWLVIQPARALTHTADRLADPDSPAPPSNNFHSQEFGHLEHSLFAMAKQLTQLQQSYRTLYENNPAIFLTVNARGELTNINRFGQEVTGLSRNELIGQRASILYCEEDQLYFEEHLRRAFAAPQKTHHWQLRHQPKDGMYRWVRDVARCIEIDNQTNALIVSQDVSDLYKLSRRLSYQASHDSLTGLINRNEFAGLLEAAIEKTRAQSVQHCVCFLDLDQFKIVNDTCGHHAGDELLKHISGVLHHAIRKDDILARLGGDEFGLLLENCSGAQAREVVSNARAAVLKERFCWEDTFFDIGISAGITIIDTDTASSQQVLSEADSACCAAKNLGRNRTIVFNDDNSAARETLDEMNWFNQINKALEASDLFLLYIQRIHDLNNDHSPVFKGEILLRMRSAEGGIIAPGAFLPAAERYHLAHKVDVWVVKHTLSTLDAHRHILPEDWVISINLSAHTISDAETGKLIFAELKKFPQFKQRICFEVTETVAMANYASASLFMTTLKDEGYSLSLDDFGSGFSSFGYLKNMPVDYVKIDGMFVRNIANDRIDQAMVSSMNSIAHAIGKATIAEFVEDQASVDILKTLDVDYAQGYFFHKPQPLVEVLTAFSEESQEIIPNQK